MAVLPLHRSCYYCHVWPYMACIRFAPFVNNLHQLQYYLLLFLSPGACSAGGSCLSAKMYLRLYHLRLCTNNQPLLSTPLSTDWFQHMLSVCSPPTTTHFSCTLLLFQLFFFWGHLKCSGKATFSMVRSIIFMVVVFKRLWLKDKPNEVSAWKATSLFLCQFFYMRKYISNKWSPPYPGLFQSKHI